MTRQPTPDSATVIDRLYQKRTSGRHGFLKGTVPSWMNTNTGPSGRITATSCDGGRAALATGGDYARLAWPPVHVNPNNGTFDAVSLRAVLGFDEDAAAVGDVTTGIDFRAEGGQCFRWAWNDTSGNDHTLLYDNLPDVCTNETGNPTRIPSFTEFLAPGAAVECEILWDWTEGRAIQRMGDSLGLVHEDSVLRWNGSVSGSTDAVDMAAQVYCGSQAFGLPTTYCYEMEVAYYHKLD